MLYIIELKNQEILFGKLITIKLILKMKEKDLKKNNIYKFNYKTYNVIGKVTKDGSSYDVHGVRYDNILKEFWHYGNFCAHNSISLATNKEKAHLEACIKAGKYVEPEDIKEVNYEIY